jgi:hypothetical protein
MFADRISQNVIPSASAWWLLPGGGVSNGRADQQNVLANWHLLHPIADTLAYEIMMQQQIGFVVKGGTSLIWCCRSW